MRNALLWLTLALSASFSVACGDEPAPSVRDPIRRDASAALDVGFLPDATDSDNDAGDNGDDASEPPDSGEAPDTGTGGDDAATDGGVEPDAEVDAGTPDSGVIVPDADNDGISDADEGNADTDGDGIPDAQDPDSDNDGIPDDVEAGDTDPSTPPVDTDNDGTPDFRDGDSDADGIDDSVEGAADPDGDGTGNYRDPDSDGDGIDDSVEGVTDTDGDMTPNYLDTDSDGDGIDDSVEGAGDPDGDMTPSYLDTDSDGDGIADSVEGAGDPDNDAVPSFLDPDADGDNIPDGVEGTGDPDGDMIPSFLDADADGDGILDLHEGTADPDNDQVPSYLDPDSDGDTLPDTLEAGDANPLTPPIDSDFDRTADFLDLDSDNDFIGDVHEGTADTDGDGIPDRLDIDADNDSLLDNVEAGDTDLATAPLNTDNDAQPDFRDVDSDNDTILDLTESTGNPDGDALPNFRDLDSDGDGVADALEAGDANPATPPVNSDTDQLPDYLDTDSDNDGLADGAEPGCPAGPSRILADSDQDGFVDPAEIAYGSNPCSGASVIDDFYFVLPPLDPPQMAPLVFSDTTIDRADVAINIDTTGSMGGEIVNLRTSLSNTIIPGVAGVIPDSAFAVSSFEDYPIEPFGATANADIPFRLGTRATTSGQAAQAAVNALITRNGLDLPESGLESLFQIASGAGTTWPGGSVPAFNPNTNRVPGIADGTIGGVGFRTDALPIIVHVTDALSHQRPEYIAVNAGIGAASTQQVLTAVDSIGARVVGIANQRLPHDPGTAICTRSTATVLGNIAAPAGSDVDFYELVGATAGQSVTVQLFAQRSASELDTQVGIFNSTAMIAFNDDIDVTTANYDSELTATLSGTGPFYIAVSSWDDQDFNGTGAVTTGYYLMNVTVAGTPFTTQVTQCRADDANTRTNATRLVTFANSTAPANAAACRTTCETVLPPLTLPYGLAERTGAVIPPCAWNLFGGTRPATCGANQCCTGINGAGVAPNLAGLCPLSFQIDDTGAGLGTAVVGGIEALVRFSTFSITTVVRGDPAELQATGFDTSCFVHGVIPVSATPPNACAPQPVIADLLPPAGVNDSFENVVPGTILSFDVTAQNRSLATNAECRPRTADPQLYRAFIDVVADGVTVVDTRDVIIIVPPQPPGGSN